MRIIRCCCLYTFVISVIMAGGSSFGDSKNLFFDMPVDISLKQLRAQYSKSILKCEEVQNFTRLKSELTWHHDQDEDSPEGTEYTCELKNRLTYSFLKDKKGEWVVWKIAKYGLDKSVSKTKSDLEIKVGKQIQLVSESINENTGIQYRFRINFFGGEIRGEAVEPYLKKEPEKLSMVDGSVEYVNTSLLGELVRATESLEKQKANKKTEEINKGGSGI